MKYNLDEAIYEETEHLIRHVYGSELEIPAAEVDAIVNRCYQKVYEYLHKIVHDEVIDFEEDE